MSLQSARYTRRDSPDRCLTTPYPLAQWMGKLPCDRISGVYEAVRCIYHPNMTPWFHSFEVTCRARGVVQHNTSQCYLRIVPGGPGAHSRYLLRTEVSSGGNRWFRVHRRVDAAWQLYGSFHAPDTSELTPASRKRPVVADPFSTRPTTGRGGIIGNPALHQSSDEWTDGAVKPESGSRV